MEIEGDVNEATGGGEVEGGVTTVVPNRNKLCQRSSHKLGVVHFHYSGIGLSCGLGNVMDLQAPELHQLSGRSVTENGKNCDAILGSKKTRLSSLAWSVRGSTLHKGLTQNIYYLYPP